MRNSTDGFTPFKWILVIPRRSRAFSGSVRVLKKRISAIKKFTGSSFRRLRFSPSLLLPAVLLAASGALGCQGAEPGAADRGVPEKFARALEAGDFDTLSEFLELEDDLDREASRILAAAIAREKRCRVKLVLDKRLSEDELFACFLMRGAPSLIGSSEKTGTPLMVSFHRADGGWRCPPLIRPRTMALARELGPAEFGKHAWVSGLLNCLFGLGSTKAWVKRQKAQAEAYELLSKPPYDIKKYAVVAQAVRKNAERFAELRTFDEFERAVAREFAEDGAQRVRPEDFYLSLYLEAREKEKALEIPFEGEKKGFFRATVYPCLTDDMILSAKAEVNSRNGIPQITATLTREGAEILKNVTRRNLKREMAIVIKGKVLMVPVIQTTIPGGRMAITGDLTVEEAQGIADRLNAPRKKALEFLETLRRKALGKENG